MSWKLEVNREAVMWLESDEGMHSNPYKVVNRPMFQLIDDIEYDEYSWDIWQAANSAILDLSIDERNAA